jgi:hypothetical protein
MRLPATVAATVYRCRITARDGKVDATVDREGST